MPLIQPRPEAPQPQGDALHDLAAPFKLIAMDEVNSTNTMAKRLCAADAEDGTLVWALRQTAGRGRLGRSWISPAGNLYFSLILRPQVSAGAAALTFVAAVAVADAVEGLVGGEAQVRCKWPNDVLVSGRKIAGILLESAATVSGFVDWVVIGIGLNVVSHPPDSETMYPATSLAAEGSRAVGVEKALGALCRSLHGWLQRWAEEGFASVRTAWLARADALGGPIAIRCGEEAVCGIFRGLDEDGAMLLDQDGALRRIAAGDVLPGGTRSPSLPAS